jgi:hypothetical protein
MNVCRIKNSSIFMPQAKEKGFHHYSKNILQWLFSTSLPSFSSRVRS